MARLLFDEQLAEVLVELLADIFPQSLHVRRLGAAARGDRAVWNLAKEHGCVLVTKDEDFHRLSVLLGAPPEGRLDQARRLFDARHRRAASSTRAGHRRVRRPRRRRAARAGYVMRRATRRTRFY